MKLIFGKNKIAITAGVLKDNNTGVVILEKLLKEGVYSTENVYDIPVKLIFENIEGIQSLISMLEFCRDDMLKARHNFSEVDNETLSR